MGRKKSYDRDETAERALETFWEKGFERTSLRDLEQSTGVNRYGLYDSFGDKAGLFEECLDQYCANEAKRFQEAAADGVEGLIGMISKYAQPECGGHKGCLVVTSLLDREGLSAALTARLERHVDGLRDRIRKVLETDAQAGKLRAHVEVEDCVDLTYLFLMGLATMARSTSSDGGVRRAADSAIRTMRSWLASGPRN